MKTILMRSNNETAYPNFVVRISNKTELKGVTSLDLFDKMRKHLTDFVEDIDRVLSVDWEIETEAYYPLYQRIAEPTISDGGYSINLASIQVVYKVNCHLALSNSQEEFSRSNIVTLFYTAIAVDCIEM